MARPARSLRSTPAGSGSCFASAHRRGARPPSEASPRAQPLLAYGCRAGKAGPRANQGGAMKRRPLFLLIVLVAGLTAPAAQANTVTAGEDVFAFGDAG